MESNVKKSLKTIVIGLAFSALTSVASVGAPIHPATSWTGQGTWPPITVTGGYIDSAAQSKDEFGDLGDASVAAAMITVPWFGPSLLGPGETELAPYLVSSGNCGSPSTVTCGDGEIHWDGSASTGANLFVVHTGKGNIPAVPPAHGNIAVDTIFAFLYSSLLTQFDLTGFAGGGSWVRAYYVETKLEGTPEVPLPGAILLLLSALGGLGFISRSRTARGANP